MKIMIVGAGIVGSIYGWALAEAGHEVRHLVRAGRADALKWGIPLDILDKRRGHPARFRGIYRIQAVEVAENPEDYDLLIYPGHHYALDEVLRGLLREFTKSGVLFITQNWRGTEDIDAVLPKDRYVFGDAKAGGSWRGKELVGAIHSVDIGPSGQEGEALARRVIACFESAGLEAPYHEKMIEYLWVQFALTGGLWPALVEAGSFKALFKRKGSGYRALAAVRDCFALLERRGVRSGDYPEYAPYLTTSRLRAFFSLALIRLMFACSEWAKRTSSHALADLREVRAFYYDILETAEALGQPMPAFASYRPAIDAFVGAGLHS